MDLHLLYLALDCPWPANNGLRQRTWQCLRALHQEGCRITLVALQGGEAPTEITVQDICDTYWILEHRVGSLSQGRHWGGRAMALLAGQPYSVRRFRSASARALLDRLWSGDRWDALVCDTVYSAVNVPAHVEPLIVNHHNIEHRIFDTFGSHAPRPWLRAAAQWEGRLVQQWEVAVGRRTAWNLVCSSADADRLQEQQPGACIQVVPNVAAAATLADPPEPEPDLVVFQGALDWLPNRDAVEYFLARIWPLVLRECPQARLQVVGRHPPPAFVARQRRHPRVEFSGTVADVRPWVARAAVAIVPLRMGSGTRLKILEAAALGKAMVATPLGAEGLDLRPGVEIEIAQQPEAFAAALSRLLRDPAARAAMG
ncbi:MAG: glycosyltransferase, partial [Terriglobales bacterium]